MKILHSLFSNGIGGTERHLAELASAQVAMGHEVFVLLRADRNPYEGLDALLSWLDPAVTILKAPRRWPLLPLAWQLRRLQPDIIHTHHRRDSRYLGLAAPRNVPVVATLHLPYRKKDYRLHTGLICIAPWQQETLPQTPYRQVAVIPNWVKPLPETPQETRQQLRETLGVTSSSPYRRILGSVGRLTPEKGIVELVQAFLQLPLSDVKLCLFGEGECRPAIEALIRTAGAEERVLLKGYDPDIRRWYAAMDGFVLPSREETFGLVLLEAMMAKLPILSTQTLGAKAVLAKHPQVHWALCGEVENLQAALFSFLPHLGETWEYPELAQYQPEAAFQKVMGYYQSLLTK